MIAPADLTRNALELSAILVRSGSPCATIDALGRIDMMMFGAEMLVRRLDPKNAALEHLKFADAVIDGLAEASLEAWKTPTEIRADLDALAAGLEAAAREVTT